MIAATNIAVAGQLPWRLYIVPNEAYSSAERVLRITCGIYEMSRPVVIILLS